MNKDLLLNSVIIKIKSADLIKINQLFLYQVKVIKQDQTSMTIRINQKDLETLNNVGIDYKVSGFTGIKHAYQFSKKNITIVLGIMIFVFILFVNTLSIKSITFSTYTKENERIKAIIEANTTNVASLKFLNTDINDINLVLRKEFSSFEWISIQRTGCNLHVTILQPSIINKQIEYIDGFGDLYATKSGVVHFFQVSHGIPMIENNQYVKEGQLLVSGNLRANTDESIFYIPASGKVFAEVWNTRTIEVPKEETKSQYTGKVFTEKSFVLFGLDITYKPFTNKYQNYDVVVTEEKLKIFGVSLPFSTKKIHYLEKNDIMNVYDKDTAYDYAYSTVKYEVSKHFSEGDKILRIDMLSVVESEDKFTYQFFVSTYENIAVFKRRNMDE